MPELPEVYTTVSQLRDTILGKTVTEVWSDFHKQGTPKAKTLKDPHYYPQFIDAVTNSDIIDIERRGKNILLWLGTTKAIHVHLKMTGHFLYGTYQKNIPGQKNHLPTGWETQTWIPDAEYTSPLWDRYNRYIHLVFQFTDGTSLALSDMRKFARVSLVTRDDLLADHDLTQLGPDPLECTATQFRGALQIRQSGKIKEVLMDQTTLAGVGNIYSDEALWKVNIHPTRDITTLQNTELTKLHTALQTILLRAIKTGGDSDSDYRNIYGKPGSFQNFHQVYRRTSNPCPRTSCTARIERVTVGGRSAHFCPACQQHTTN